MTYDVAVWEGDLPEDDETAGVVFDQLYERYLEANGPEPPPTPRIAAYVRALLDRYPDLDAEGGEDSPWASSPLAEEALGTLMYFPLVPSRSDQVAAWAAELARQHGLVCYDPQLGQLR